MGKTIYQSPVVEILDVVIEAGIALSDISQQPSSWRDM